MFVLSLLFIIVNAILAVVAFYNFYWKRRKLPPGPTPLPIVGNMLTIAKRPAGEDCYNEWAKQYGPIFTFWLGELPVVIVTDYKLIMEMFQKDGDTYAGRLIFSEFNKLMKGGTYGVIQTEGDLWRDQRRFALHVLRDFGVGKNLMQEKILTEIAARFEKLNDDFNSSNIVQLDCILDVAVGSIINDLLFGYRFDETQMHEFRKLKQIASMLIKMFNRVEQHIMSQFPATAKLPHFRGIFEELCNHFKELHIFYTKQIVAHEAEINFDDLDAPSTDYVEAFLKERKRRENAGEIDHYYTQDQLIHMCFDLWIAGQETSSTTIAWGIAHVLHNPRIQRRLQAELDAVIRNTDRFVTVADKQKLPYVNAVVNEFQRIANLLPINVLRRTTRDVTVNGHFLPKGTCIIPQVCAVLYNEDYFPNRMKFDPDRYLTADGKLGKCDELIPFSVGKRQCLGEPLARMELFLFIANIFNQYKLTPCDEMPSLERRLGGTVTCPHFKCHMKRRVVGELV